MFENPEDKGVTVVRQPLHRVLLTAEVFLEMSGEYDDICLRVKFQ